MILAPIKEDKRTIAILAIEIDVDPLFKLLHDSNGTETSDETLIVKKSGEHVIFLSPPKSYPDLIMRPVDTKVQNLDSYTNSVYNKDDGFSNNSIDYTGQKSYTYWSYLPKMKWGLVTTAPALGSSLKVRELKTYVNIIVVGLIILMLVCIIILVNRFTRPLNLLKENINYLVKGGRIKRNGYARNNDLKVIGDRLVQISNRLDSYTTFTENLKKGDFSENLKDENEPLAKSLNEVKTELLKIYDENDKRKWASDGFNTHGEILLENSENLEVLGQKLISSLVNFLGAQHGALFTIKQLRKGQNESHDAEVSYERIAAFAFNESSFRVPSNFKLGQGLIGQSAKEKKVIKLENTSLLFSEIESGLGKAHATYLVIIPLKINEEVLGVLEIGSFSALEEYKVDFLERLGENIASSLLTIIASKNTADLLKENQLVLENLKRKEEELIENQSSLIDSQKSLKENYENALKDITKLKKENQELRDTLNSQS